MKNTTEFVPLPFILNFYGSNGMCAGNSYFEALVNGICEVIERFVSIDIFEKKHELPSLSIFSLNDEELIGKIQGIKNEYYIEIKDCTLGNRYPAVGIYIINVKTGEYIFKIGAHPVLEVAVDKTINEIFQGNDLRHSALLKSYYDVSLNYIDNIDSILKNGSAEYAFGINKDEYIEVPSVFKKIDVDLCNEDLYKYLCFVFKSENLDILIHDMSFLGFPAYHVLVPNFSEIYKFRKDILISLSNSLFKELKEKKNIIKILKHTLKTDLDIDGNMYEKLGITLSKKSYYTLITGDYINFATYIQKDDIGNALSYLRRYISWLKNKNMISVLEHYKLLYIYISNLGNLSSLKRYFNIVKKDINIYTNEFEALKRGIKLGKPECPNCDYCIMKEDCYSKYLISLHVKLQKLYKLSYNK